jgi:uncharacterized protein YlzI (FlbEa/FlbD family)
MNFLKLTDIDGDAAWINLDTVTNFQQIQSITRMEFLDGSSFAEVKETPEEIIELITNEF